MSEQSSIYNRGAGGETSNATVRKYPRTMNEAFGFGADYGCAITVYRNPMRNVTYWAMLVVVAVVAYGLLSWVTV